MTAPITLTAAERRFLARIAGNPGSAAASLPRPKRGSTLRSLEMVGLIHYGPGGWYVTPAGEAALAGVAPKAVR